MVNSTNAAENRLPTPRDFTFLRWVDPKSPSRAAVDLLAEYAANAAYFFHARNKRYLVECLVNVRKFSEYVVTYVETKESIPPLRSIDQSTEIQRGRFARRLENIKTARPDLGFPHVRVTRIWRDAGDAVHPPEGLSAKEISDYKNNYQVKAEAALKDAFQIALWLKTQYGSMWWLGRLFHRFRNRSG
jgi:hypothetical protein